MVYISYLTRALINLSPGSTSVNEPTKYHEILKVLSDFEVTYQYFFRIKYMAWPIGKAPTRM